MSVTGNIIVCVTVVQLFICNAYVGSSFDTAKIMGRELHLKVSVGAYSLLIQQVYKKM